MNVQPIGGIHPAFESWLERRRARLQAQIAALDTERLDELVTLLGQEEQDRPPTPRTLEERHEYLRMLREQERLTERIAVLRRRLIAELEELDRERVRLPPEPRNRSVGHTFDGYA